MGYVDWVKNHNAIESLPANVKAQAVEVARPAAQLITNTTDSQPPQGPAPVPNTQGRGRGLSIER